MQQNESSNVSWKIEAIDQNSPYLDAVKILWRANSATLGFFPDGAFLDHAARKTILVATIQDVGCIGYLLYRISRDRVTIAHLCVDKAWQGKGVAKGLVTALSNNTKNYRGIGLRCRRDFAASQIWSPVGFVAQHDQPGKSHDGKELTYWWLDHNHLNIWTVAEIQRAESILRVAIDANVFFDLQDEENLKEESKSLLADWLQEYIELCTTQEIHNEIHRNTDSAKRQRLHQIAANFTSIRNDVAKFDMAVASLRKYFPEQLSDSDRSDLYQISRALDGGVPFFVTRDEDLLDKSEQIYENFNLRIIRPSDLIIHLDELRRETEYHPVRLAATSLEIRRVKNVEEIKAFRSHAPKEAQAEFLPKIRRFMSDPNKFVCLIATDFHGEQLALMVYDRLRPDELVVPIFRVKRTALAATVARYLILQTLRISANEQRQITKITDQFLNPHVTAALQDDAFILVENDWIKANLQSAQTAKETAHLLNAIAARGIHENEYCQRISVILNRDEALSDAVTMAEIEKLLWPAKILDSEIPTYIIPIQPRWAQELFDEAMAKQTLFGANEKLALNREAVYYRASKPNILSTPARILWYVSQDSHYQGSMSLRACSRLDEVVIGKPKDLFRQYRRLGVYEWNNIIDVAHGDLDKEIMAARFNYTQVFPNPIGWNDLQKILREAECPSQLQSPHRIPKAVFSQLYKLGNE